MSKYFTVHIYVFGFKIFIRFAGGVFSSQGGLGLPESVNSCYVLSLREVALACKEQSLHCMSEQGNGWDVELLSRLHSPR